MSPLIYSSPKPYKVLEYILISLFLWIDKQSLGRFSSVQGKHSQDVNPGLCDHHI